jgi:hypothetical protein
MRRCTDVGGVAAEGVDAGANRVALSTEKDMAASQTEILKVPARPADRLVSDNEKVVPRLAAHGLEVVDDVAAAAPAAGGDDDPIAGRALRAR